MRISDWSSDVCSSDLVIIGCDSIVTTSAEVLSKVRKDATRAAVNSAPIPTADFIKNPSWRFPDAAAQKTLTDAMGAACEFLDANALAVYLLGDAIYANPLRSEEHTSELQSLMRISYAVFCLKKKKKKT